MGDSLDGGFEHYDVPDLDDNQVQEEDDAEQSIWVEGNVNKRKLEENDDDDVGIHGERLTKKKKKKNKNKNKGETKEVTSASLLETPKKSKLMLKQDTQTLTSTEKQCDFLWERYCSLLNDVELNPIERQVCVFEPRDFVVPTQGKSKSKTNKKDKGKEEEQEDNKKCKVEAAKSITNFLKATIPELQSLSSDKNKRVIGSPLVIVLSSSAVRANELAKDLRIKIRNLKTAKLFAKHLKLHEQIQSLQQEYYALAVGTPNRIHKLLTSPRNQSEVAVLSLASTRLIVLDIGFRDAKDFHLLNLPSGVARDLAILFKDFVIQEMVKRRGKDSSAPLKIGFFL